MRCSLQFVCLYAIVVAAACCTAKALTMQVGHEVHW